MQISIRTKLVGLMAIVTLLPLVVSLAVIVLGGQSFRTETVGRGVFAQAQTESRVMQTRLEDDIRLIRVVATESMILDALAKIDQQAKTQRATLEREAKAIEAQWPTLTTAALKAYLNSPIAELLRSVRQGDSLISEVIVADSLGRVLAASNKTTDFIQSDEEWWQTAMSNGGTVTVYPIAYDRSADAWTIDFVIPIHLPNQPKAVGVAKASVQLERWLPSRGQFGFQDSGWYRLYQPGGQPQGAATSHSFQMESPDESDPHSAPRLSHRTILPEVSDELATITPPGRWLIEEERVIAQVPLFQTSVTQLSNVKFPQVYLELTFPMTSTQVGLDTTGQMILMAGLVAIVLLFIGGILLIDRSILRRICRIRQSAEVIASGDLKERVDVSWRLTRLLGTDEIDDLGREINHMVRQLHSGREDVEQANALKENFLRIAGHELRTPVSYIVGMATLMKESDDIERIRKAVDTMGFKASRLDEIIQAMFKLIPEESLDERLHLQPISLDTISEVIRSNMDPWLTRREQTLEIEMPENRFEVYADRAKLVDILENLVMNAIKFTPNGGTVCLRFSKQLGQNLAIKVTDQGPGIPSEDQPHIFKPFYSGADILRHSTGKSGFNKRGMGLGLAIVKHFVMLHHGKIDFHTSEAGTTFTVTIPLVRPSYDL